MRRTILNRPEEPTFDESDTARRTSNRNEPIDRSTNVSLGPLRMSIQLAVRTRVSDGLLLYANDNFNNFVQLHLFNWTRLCWTLNVAGHLVRGEIHLPGQLISRGAQIQIRVRRYDQVSTLLAAYNDPDDRFTANTSTARRTFVRRLLVLRVPFGFLRSYSQKPFRLGVRLSAVAHLPLEQMQQVVDVERSLRSWPHNNGPIQRAGAAEQVIPLRRFHRLQMSNETLLQAREELQLRWQQHDDQSSWTPRISANDAEDERNYLQHLTALAKTRGVTLLQRWMSPEMFANRSNRVQQPNASVDSFTRSQQLNHSSFTQVYVGNVDGHNTLSTLPGFRGCVSGLVVNNKHVNLTQIAERRNAPELKSGHISFGCRMLCDISDCRNRGKH